jgi:hypothetical protein
MLQRMWTLMPRGGKGFWMVCVMSLLFSCQWFILPISNHWWTRLEFLKGSRSKLRTARGSTMETTTQDHIRRPVASMMVMGIQDFTGMEGMDTICVAVMGISTVEEMATTIMATRTTITTPGEGMDTTMAITATVTRAWCRRILVK